MFNTETQQPQKTTDTNVLVNLEVYLCETCSQNYLLRTKLQPNQKPKTQTRAANNADNTRRAKSLK